MTNTDTTKSIAAKIAKCLNLANSDNPNEAQAAKRQAEALMKKYSLTSADVAASTINQQQLKATHRYQLPVYLANLACVIAKAFGCETTVTIGNKHWGSNLNFFGVGIKPELCAYTYSVLRRQLLKDRKDYRDSLTRYKPTNRTRKADLFCEAWVVKVASQVSEFAGTEQEKAAIAAYHERRGAKIIADTRKGAVIKDKGDYSAWLAGNTAAAEVSLHKPVQTKHKTALLG
jgi:hypothetical protein